MFSRILSALLVFVFMGCSLRVNEEVEQSKVAVNPLQSGCLANSSALVNRYFEGSAQEEEVNSYFACVEKALETFSKNTTGSKEEHFLGTELAGFLSKYFLNGKTIDPRFVQEVMYLKQGILGGTSDRITRQEIDTVIGILRVIKNVALENRVNMPLSSQSLVDRNYSIEKFEKAIDTFQKGMGTIGNALSKGQSSYSFDRLGNLLKETKLFLYPEMQEQEMWLDKAMRLTFALRPAKAIFISPPQDEIRDTDWAKIYYLAPRYYSLYLRAKFYLNTEAELTHGSGLAHLETVFTETIRLVELALGNQVDKAIKSEELDLLITALQQNDLLPFGLQDATIKSGLRYFFVRLMEERSLREQFVITQSTLDNLKETFRFSTEGMRAIEFAFRKELGSNFSRGTISPEAIARISNKELLDSTVLKNELSQEAITAVKMVASKVRTITRPDGILVYVPHGKERMGLNQSHMNFMHLLYSFNRLIFKSYGERSDYLTEKQIQQAANELFPILEDLGHVSAETRLAIPKRLFEASLFLYASDGSLNVTMAEALELEALLFSTMIKGGKIQEQLAAKCDARNKDKTGRYLIPAPCFKGAFLEHLQENWSQIPGLYKFFRSKTYSERVAILEQINNFLRKGRTKEEYTFGDTNSFILFPYYVELLYSRFDKNRDNYLDNEEARAAYHVFRPFLSQKAREKGLTDPEDHYALYMFLLGYQTLPDNMPSTWLWRRYITQSKDFKVDRGQVIQIFEKILAL